jgi:hypothetical protein
MALLGKLVTLAKSPQGRKLLVQAQKIARDPQNRERLEKVRSKVQTRGAATTKPSGSHRHQGTAGAEGENPPPR